MANPTSNIRLFEVNLIGDRVSTFFRRRAFQKWCMVAALALLLAGGVMAVRAVMNVSAAWNLNNGIQAAKKQIKASEAQLAQLDIRMQEAQARVNEILPLVPVAKARVSWAPKLAALAGAFPPGTILMTFRASQGDLFSGLAAAHPNAEALASGIKINFAVIYARSASPLETPVLLVQNLQKSESFMRQLNHVGLESLEQEAWLSKSVMVLRGSAEGARLR